MNKLLLQLLNMSNQVKFDGEIVIPPNFNEQTLTIQVRWYLERRYCFSRSFNLTHLQSSNIDFSQEFIAKANQEIEKIIRLKNKNECTTK